DEPASEADDRGGARADALAGRGLSLLRARRGRGPVDADRPREAARDAALDHALPSRAARAAGSRRARPESGRPPVVPDPPHAGRRAVARRGAASVSRLCGGGRGTSRQEAHPGAPCRARGVARGRRRRARRARLAPLALDSLGAEEGGEALERLLEVERLLARLPPQALDAQHALEPIEDGLDPADEPVAM